MKSISPNARVLILDHAAVISGAEASLLALLQIAKFQSHVCLFCDGPLRTQLKKMGIPVSVIKVPKSFLNLKRGEGFFRDLLALPQLFLLATKVAYQARSFDLILANSQKAFFVGVLASWFSRRPIIWHLHDILSEEHFSRTHLLLCLFFAKYCASQVIACSKSGAEPLLEMGCNPASVSVAYPRIDATPFENPNPLEKELLRSKLNLKPGVPVIGVFGRLAPWKGQDIFIKALKDIPEAQGIIVGGALFGENEYESKLKELVKEENLEGRIHFLDHRQDLPQLMQLCDIVVHTSTAPEPFGRVIVEAMLAGRPVIASKAGGVMEIIEDKVTGILIPPGDASALSREIKALLGNPEKIANLGMAGRKFALESFASDQMLQVINNVIENTLL